MHGVVGQIGDSLWIVAFGEMDMDGVCEAGCRCYGLRFIADARGGWT